MAAWMTTWWKRDVALHSFVVCQFLISLPFSVFNTYVTYQLQVVGYLIGTDDSGLPCTTYCIVPWGGSRLDLNSVLLYLNALAFAIGGALTLFLSAYSDFSARKHLLVTFFIVCYGILSIPVYWLQDYTTNGFQTLTALYVAFNIVTLILIAVLNIYIPHCMRSNGTKVSANLRHGEPKLADAVRITNDPHASAKRRYGFNMSIFATIAVSAGAIFVYIIVIILSETLSGGASQSAGLLVTTVVGFVTVVGSLVAFFGLPAIPSKSSQKLKGGWSGPLVEFFMPFKDFFIRKSMAALLVSYTIYTDSTFAVSSVIGQLFISEIHPGALEYTLYALAQSLSSLGCTMAFLWLRPHVPIRLETWLITGYALILLIPIWACIGLSNADFGFKHRWEFYAQYIMFNMSAALVNASFRVLFSEMVPVGNEVRWFGMQLILSCATIWVSYVASGPLQNATHQLRFPIIICLVFLALALVIEICRVTMSVFATDRQKWMALDQTSNVERVEEVKAEDMTEQHVMVNTKA